MKYPPTHLANPAFVYTRAERTDIRATFERARQQSRGEGGEGSDVDPSTARTTATPLFVERNACK